MRDRVGLKLRFLWLLGQVFTITSTRLLLFPRSSLGGVLIDPEDVEDVEGNEWSSSSMNEASEEGGSGEVGMAETRISEEVIMTCLCCWGAGIAED